MKLTQEKIKELIIQHKKEKDGPIRDRIKTVLLINMHYSYKEVARILFVDDDTVRCHIEEYGFVATLQKRNNSLK